MALWLDRSRPPRARRPQTRCGRPWCGCRSLRARIALFGARRSRPCLEGSHRFRSIRRIAPTIIPMEDQSINQSMCQHDGWCKALHTYDSTQTEADQEIECSTVATAQCIGLLADRTHGMEHEPSRQIVSSRGLIVIPLRKPHKLARTQRPLYTIYLG